jgi:hypothetical protein
VIVARRGSRATARVAGALLLAALALLALAWLGPSTAQATFPGENGKIAFERDGAIRAVNPDGTGEIFFTCPEGEVIDPSERRAYAPIWSPDGRRIAFNRRVPSDSVAAPDLTRLFTLNPDGTENSFGGQDDFSPAWSPDGERIAFLGAQWSFEGFDDFVVVANHDGSDRTTLAEEARSPAWSPDGERIAFERDGGIWVMNADGSDQTLLAEQAVTPAWSPDGERIAFERDGGIWVMNADGSDQTLLAEQAVSPAWSPDGERIAFERDGGIWVMNADGSDPRRLAEGEGATWSPDSQRIAFARSGALWVVNADGGDARLLVTGWGPDWQAIAPGTNGVPISSQPFCFTGLRRNTNRGTARLVVEVSRPGRVVLRRGRGVRPFARAHREAGAGRVVLRVRPRGRVKRKLERRAIVRLPVPVRVTYRPPGGEPRTRSGRLWLVRAPRRCRPVDNERVRVIRIQGTLGCKRIRRLAARTVYRGRPISPANTGFYCAWYPDFSSGFPRVKVNGRTYIKGFCRVEGESRLRVSFLGLRKKADLWERTFTSTAVTEDGEPRPLVPGTRIRMYFNLHDAEEGRGNAEWSAGCGRFSTNVRVTTERIRFDPIRRRDLSPECGEDRQRQNDWLADLFESDPRWRLRDRRLVLRSAGIVIRLRAGRG